MNIIPRIVSAEDNVSLANMIRKVFIEHGAPQKGTVYSDPTTDHLFELFQAPKSELWVAETDGEIVGCCGIYPTEGLPENCVELVKFYLAHKARGKGIGRALMQQCVDRAKVLGFTHMYIESLPDFAKAVSIYEKQGFVRLKHPMGNSGHSGCNIWMVKEIKN